MTLEGLLYELIEKGWKPYGISRVKNVVALNHYISFSKRTILGIEFFEYTLRSLVSKESGLWQFVCDKGLVEMYEGWYWQNIFPLDSKEYDYTDYQYWILESSLIDEDKLEKFLIDNIKVEGTI